MSIIKNDIKKIKSLQTKKGRSTHRIYVAEGIRLLEEALFHSVLPACVYYSSSLTNPRAESVLKKITQKKVKTVKISAQNLQKISYTESPQGLVALFNIPVLEQKKLIAADCRRILWCENISDPGNMGTLIRTGLAFGFKTIIYSGSSADPYSPKVVRSSVGSIFGVRIIKSEINIIMSQLKNTGFKLLAADKNGIMVDKTLSDIKKNQKLALAVGSEADGLSQEILDETNFKIRIDHSADVESLNAAIAGSIIMSRIARV